jgi:hypothetical protein
MDAVHARERLTAGPDADLHLMRDTSHPRHLFPRVTRRRPEIPPIKVDPLGALVET